MRVIHKIAVAGVVVATLVSVGMGTAFADPPATPTLTTIVGVNCPPLFVGSPVENVGPSIVADYNAINPAYPVACWDAVNPASPAGGNITAKAANAADISCRLARPATVDAGIAALNVGQEDASLVNGQPVYCIDFVFSDRAPHAGTSDTFASLARDAITWSYPKVGGQVNPQPASLTLAQLIAIYTCKDTTWNEVNPSLPATPTIPIVPVLPQLGSGTRDTFLAALGIAANQPCWVNGVAANGDVIVEDTGLSAGNVNQFTLATSVDDIFPYSIGDWIAQTSPAVKGTGAAGTPGGATVGGHANPIWGHGDLALGETVNGLLGVAEEPVTMNSYGQPVINFANWEPQLTRLLYDVVRNGCPSTGACFPVTPAYEAVGLPALFSSKGWVCTNAIAQSDIVSYGFLNLGSNCGVLTPGG
jgi:hypothetical protein